MDDLEDLFDVISNETGIDFFEDLGDLFSSLDSGVVATIVAVTIVATVLIAIVSLATYIVQAWGLYQMAKKVGYRKAWLAWIPYANHWLMFNLPTKEYKVLAVNKILNRNVAFWIYIAITVGGAYVMTAIGMIPYIGQLIGALGRLVILVATVFMLFPMYKDMFLMYYEDSNAQGYAIASTIGAFVAPILPALLMVFTSGKTPREYVVDNDGTAIEQN